MGLAVFTIVLSLLIIVGVVVFIFVINRMNKARHDVGTFVCSYRSNPQQQWSQGRAVYNVETLDWYPLISFSSKPRHSWDRRAFDIKKTFTEESPTGDNVMILHVRVGKERFQLMVSEADHSGIVSWMEAAPPRSVDWS